MATKNSSSNGWGGLLVVGAVLVLAAVAIKVGIQDSEAQPAAQADNANSAATGLQLKGDHTVTTSANTHPGNVDHANDSDFEQKVLRAEGRVLVDFYADWCGPCRMVGPVLEEIAREEPSAKIVKVNVDDSNNVAFQYQIEAIPALLVFENGKVVEQKVGVASKAELRRMLGL